MCALAVPRNENKFFNFKSTRHVVDVIKKVCLNTKIFVTTFIYLYKAVVIKFLKLMNRQHTIKEYLKLIENINNEIPNCGISHDMIVWLSK